MTACLTTEKRKSTFRKALKLRRRSLVRDEPFANAQSLIKSLPQDFAQADIIGGYSPIGDEIDIWPVLKALHKDGRRIALPVVIGPDQPLVFREWTPSCSMKTDRYGVSYPAAGQPLLPQLIFVPLLAFTPDGDRLGYGGGYYDRTLAKLRANNSVFACGVAYAGQEVPSLPTDDHDEHLDGVLTEDGFRKLI